MNDLRTASILSQIRIVDAKIGFLSKCCSSASSMKAAFRSATDSAWRTPHSTDFRADPPAKTVEHGEQPTMNRVSPSPETYFW